MAKLNARGSVAGSGTIFKVFVPPSTSANVVVPTAYNTDGTLSAANGNSVTQNVQLNRITCVAAGAVAIYDANAVASATTATQIWGKTVAAGDIYVIDTVCVNGLYITTDVTARVALHCC